MSLTSYTSHRHLRARNNLLTEMTIKNLTLFSIISDVIRQYVATSNTAFFLASSPFFLPAKFSVQANSISNYIPTLTGKNRGVSINKAHRPTTRFFFRFWRCFINLLFNFSKHLFHCHDTVIKHFSCTRRTDKTGFLTYWIDRASIESRTCFICHQQFRREVAFL